MLNYKNFDDIIEAFKKNNNFRIRFDHNGDIEYRKVLFMQNMHSFINIESKPFYFGKNSNLIFRLDGSYGKSGINTLWGCTLTLEEVVEEVVVEAEDVIPVAKSFVERFSSGEKLIRLKGKLHVTELTFKTDGVLVKFLDEHNDIIFSRDYNADGKHKFNSELDLSFQPMSEKVVMYSSEDLYIKCSAGVYQDSADKNKYVIIISDNSNQILEYDEESNELGFYCKDIFHPYQQKYVLTDKKFNFSIVK
jgi:hypothetical protein